MLQVDRTEPGDLPGRDLQGGEQSGGAVPDIVVGALLGMTGLHRQVSWVRFNAWIWDFSSIHSTIAFFGGLRYRPITSLTLASSSGSVENLNVSAFHGFTPYRFQAAAMRCFLTLR
jgi:hypothetical protein